MTLTLPIFKYSALRWLFRGTTVKPATEVTPEHEDAYAERVFLRELLARNPEAIQSDIGFMAMMAQYPRYF